MELLSGADAMRWYDGAELVVEGQGWPRETLGAPYDRLPAKAQGIVRQPVWDMSRCSAGLMLHIATEAPELTVRWKLINPTLAGPTMAATGFSGVDLYRRQPNGAWRYAATGQPTAQENTATLPAGGELLLDLPLCNGLESLAVGIDPRYTVTPIVAQGKPIVIYGTSITQGNCASRPGMAGAAILRRHLDVPVINLGFAGVGQMEPELCDLLCELDPQLYVLDCLWNMNPEMIAERVEPFVHKLRAKHLDTPIVLLEDSQRDNQIPTANGLACRAAFQRLVAAGVPSLSFVPAIDMLGDDGECVVDGVHHTDLGMMRQAQVIEKALRPLVFK